MEQLICQPSNQLYQQVDQLRQFISLLKKIIDRSPYGNAEQIGKVSKDFLKELYKAALNENIDYSCNCYVTEINNTRAIIYTLAYCELACIYIENAFLVERFVLLPSGKTDTEKLVNEVNTILRSLDLDGDIVKAVATVVNWRY